MEHSLSYIIWDPDLFAFHIGSFGIRWYSLCWGIGLALAYILVRRLYKEQKIKNEYFDPLLYIALWESLQVPDWVTACFINPNISLVRGSMLSK